MSTLARETQFVQNPALGSVLLWRFACGYSDQHPTSGYPPIQTAFLVLPIMLHADTLEILKSTNRPSGLHGFADKFSRSEVGKSDLLLGVQRRCVAWRELTWDSLKLGIQTRLVTLSSSNATLIPITTSTPSSVPSSVAPLLTNAAKLGGWCANLSLFEIGTLLKVAF